MFTPPQPIPLSLETLVQNELFTTKCAALGLTPILTWLKEKNLTGNILPYHNNFHMLQVARLADELLALHGSPHQRSVITAALFHDYGHSGGLLSDTQNIEHAVIGFMQFVDANLLTDVELPRDAQEEVVDLIRITEFPPHREPKTIQEKCLYDADRLVCLSDSTIPMVMHGLREEMSKARGGHIYLADMLTHQRQFIETTTMYSPMGRILWEKYKVVAIERFTAWVKAQAPFQGP